MRVVVGDCAEGDRPQLLELLQRLKTRGNEVVAMSTAANDMLAAAGIQHSFEAASPETISALLNDAWLVLASASSPDQAQSKLLSEACNEPERKVVICDKTHFALARNGPEQVTPGQRKQLAEHTQRCIAEYAGAKAQEGESTSPVNVMVVGSGGREHALALKLSESLQVSQVFVAPGNGGTSSAGPKISNLDQAKLGDHAQIIALAKENNVGLVVVGPDQLLVDGFVDKCQAAGISCFGPSQLAARLEGSKAFCKAFMERHNIPSARFATFTDHDSAVAHVEQVSYPVVIKASGLAAGKGVILPSTLDESKAALKEIMVDKVFGESGAEVVIEERLIGEEVSVLAFCDGTSAVLMPGAQDHKRVFDQDQGPNTGGMGAYAPAPLLSPALKASVALDVIQQAVDGARDEGFPFVGVLYAGIMVTAEGPRVLEFNCRFGDPETQVILPLLESDLFEVLQNCVNGCLLAKPISFSENHCVTVVLASKGYPSPTYEKGAAVNIGVLPDDVSVVQAGTKVVSDGSTVTCGGRVLNVVAKAKSLENAVKKAYDVLEAGTVGFENAHFRKDIAKRALRSPPKLGVLGSTRGTDLQYIIDAIDKGWLRASIEVVVSNKKSAYILTRASEHGLTAVSHSIKGCADRTEFDAQVTKTLTEHNVDFVLLIGYMRILSDAFVERWVDRTLNVHPSLLPEFAGGMDLNVHQEVIDAKKEKTGCTIHLVTSEVDGGPIVVQKSCPVLSTDDADTLKARVQALEGPAFVEAINALASKDLAL